jgi:peptide/nickel transport system substrate-binding protein
MFGYDPSLAPYPFDPSKARQLLREVGHPGGLSISLIATEDLEVQATVISRMLEQAGFKVARQIHDTSTYNRKIVHPFLDQPAEKQTWDIALKTHYDLLNFPLFHLYIALALDGLFSWVMEPPELRRLYNEVLRTIDREKQQALIRQMERDTKERAYFLFLYNPVGLFAANKAVRFVPYLSTSLILDETSVADQHWSVRKGAKK